MRSSFSPSAGSTIVDKLKTYEGGTGSATASDARVALDVVSSSDINQPNGIAGLDNSGLLNVSVFPTDNGPSPISIVGAVEQLFSTVGYFTIRNFDVFTNYVLETIDPGATIARNRDKIAYTAGSAQGPGGFKINGRAFNVTVIGYRPNKPTLSVIDAYGGSNAAVLQCTGSAYAVNGGSATHLNTDWQVATDSAFNNVVSSSLADATNKTTWTSSALNLSTTYYTRCRYRDSNNAVSPWSDAISITTKASYLISTEEAKLVGSDLASSDQMGCSISVNSDGTRVVIGAFTSDPSGATNAGAAYVFLRTGTSWTQEAKLVASDKAAGDYFGWSVSISGDATRIIVGAYDASPSGLTNAGAAYIFLRTGSTWAQEAKLVASDAVGSDMFGYSAAMDSTGSRVAIGSPNSSPNGATSGSVYVFLRTGSTWAQEAKLIGTGGSNAKQMGWSVAITSDASRVAAGAVSDSQINTSAGAAYIFLRTGTSWAQEARFIPTDSATNDQFGKSIDIDNTGTRAIVGAWKADIGGNTDCGAAYIFLRTGTSWAQEAKLVASDNATNDFFGACVAINSNGSRVSIGAYSADTGGLTDAGAVYVSSRNGTVWAQESKLSASDKNTSDQFGRSVTIDDTGSRVLVGSMVADSVGIGSDSGAAYVYH